MLFYRTIKLEVFSFTLAKRGAWSDFFLPRYPKKYHEQPEQSEQSFKIKDLHTNNAQTKSEQPEQSFKIKDLDIITLLTVWLPCCYLVFSCSYIE